MTRDLTRLGDLCRELRSECEKQGYGFFMLGAAFDKEWTYIPGQPILQGFYATLEAAELLHERMGLVLDQLNTKLEEEGGIDPAEPGQISRRLAVRMTDLRKACENESCAMISFAAPYDRLQFEVPPHAKARGTMCGPLPALYHVHQILTETLAQTMTDEGAAELARDGGYHERPLHPAIPSEEDGS